MKKIVLTLFVTLSFLNAKSQISIASARAMSIGSTVTIRGIVLNGSEMGTIRYLEDGTAGMALYSATLSNTQRGDSIEVTGVTTDYSTLIEMNPVNTFTVISTGNPVPAAKVLTMANGFVEAYEGQLVRFNASHFLSTGNFSSSNAAYNATDGTLVSAQLYVYGQYSNFAGTPIPVGDVDLIGIMGEHTSTYQLLPRDVSDFVVGGNPPVITTILSQYNIATTSFDISFSTQNNGNTILYYGLTQALGSEVNDATMTTSHVVSLSGLTAGTIYYVKAASISSSGDTSFSSVQPMATQSLSTQTIKCYFVRPVDNTVAQGVNAVSLAQNMADTMIAYMNRAKYTMDVAIYNMDNNNGIVDAINAAYNRGVAVRIIGDGSAMGLGSWNQLLIGSANMKLSPTSIDYGIMHNKFIAIDAYSANPNDAILWTGSMNFTDQQVNTDANNVIIFQDQSLVKGYEIEFNEMFNTAFGPFKTNNTPKEFSIGGNRVELYFSPTDDAEGRIKSAAESADHDLQFCVYSFTRIPITYAIDDRTSVGVWGGGIIDDTANLSYGYGVLLQDMPNTLFVASHSYLVHNKYLIVDANDPAHDPLVLTGSHNWTNSAQTKNDENIVVVHNASIANQYYQEWVARYHDEGGVDLPGYISGVNDPSASQTLFQYYPNPSSAFVNVVFAGKEDAVIQLTDITGKILQQFDAHNTDHVQLSTQQLAQGVYILNVKQGTSSNSAKLVIEK